MKIWTISAFVVFVVAIVCNTIGSFQCQAYLLDKTYTAKLKPGAVIQEIPRSRRLSSLWMVKRHQNYGGGDKKKPPPAPAPVFERKLKSGYVELEGRIVECMRSIQFRVELKESKQKIVCGLCGKMIKNKLRCVVGDSVVVELNTADISSGRIVYRHRTGDLFSPVVKDTVSNDQENGNDVDYRNDDSDESDEESKETDENLEDIDSVNDGVDAEVDDFEENVDENDEEDDEA